MIMPRFKKYGRDRISKIKIFPYFSADDGRLVNETCVEILIQGVGVSAYTILQSLNRKL